MSNNKDDDQKNDQDYSQRDTDIPNPDCFRCYGAGFIPYGPGLMAMFTKPCPSCFPQYSDELPI